MTILIFQHLYGQSLDYICGLSAERELDMLASTVNHVVNQSRGMVEHLTQELATSLVEHIKAISKNDHEALLEESKALCGAIIDSKLNNPIVTKRLANLMRTVRRIESKQARQVMAVETHMMQVKQRLDKEDKHIMLSDLDCDYQYSLPLPEPVYSDEEMVKGVD